jgi:hypothetical protein
MNVDNIFKWLIVNELLLFIIIYYYLLLFIIIYLGKKTRYNISI